MMFGFFKSKKKKEAMRESERQDTFYSAETVEEEEEEVSDIDDEEYYRRVAKEITRRKESLHDSNRNSSRNSPTTGNGSSHGGQSPRAEASAPPSGIHGKTNDSLADNPVPVKVAPSSTIPSSGLKLAPVGSLSLPTSTTSTPRSNVPTPHTPNTPFGASTPILSAPPTAASRAAASRPNAATNGPNPSAFAITVPTRSDRPFSATSAPGTPITASTASSPASSSVFAGRTNTSLVPDPKALKSLVLMGFSYPAATLALQRTNNHSDRAAEFLLNHSEADINALLAGLNLGTPKV